MLNEYKKYRQINNNIVCNEFIQILLQDSEIYTAIRSNSLIAYYKGQKILTIKINENNNVFIKKSKKDSKGNDILNEISRKYVVNNSEKALEFKDYTKEDFIKYIDHIKKYVKEYNIESPIDEKEIQIDFASNYKPKNNSSFMIIDVEYAKSYPDKETKDSSINELGNGRCDFIALLKEEDKYKVAFIELKSLEGAVTNKTSGVIKHYKDMKKVFNHYCIEDGVKNIPSDRDVIFTLFQSICKIYNLDIESQIDFDNPKYYLMFEAKVKNKNSMLIELAQKEFNKLSSGAASIMRKTNICSGYDIFEVDLCQK